MVDLQAVVELVDQVVDFFGAWGVRKALSTPHRPGSPVKAASVTLEPDGQATGCNPVQRGSTPLGVSLGHPSSGREDAAQPHA